MRALWWAILAVSLLGQVPTSLAGVIDQYGGTYANWPTTWTSIAGINDPLDGVATRLDFVGDATNPGGYWAMDANYVYFRVRVAVPTIVANTYSDTVMVLIDRAGMGSTNHADYGFAWDSKSGNNVDHGLEMMIPATNENQWQANRMDDIDGSSGQKLTRDINGGGRTNEGYIRTIDQQPTTNFGMTSFIDFAVSWDYLENPLKGNTQLSHTDLDWRITFASIANANDHNLLNTDIAGGANPPSDVSIGWSQSLAVPKLTTTPANGGTLDFGYVLVDPAPGVGTQTRSLTATNTGEPGSNLNGTFPAASGDFTPANTQAFGPLAQNASASRDYTYEPQSRGADTLAVTVTSDGGSSTITLSGTGVAPVSNLPNGNSLDYGVVLVGMTSDLSLAVRNTGDGNLSDPGNLTDADNLRGTAPAGSAPFTLQGSATIDLTDNTTANYAYRYAPTLRSPSDTANLDLNFSNGKQDGTNQAHDLNFSLTGQAVAPVNQVSLVNDAGLTRVGTTSTARVRVDNLGNGNESGVPGSGVPGAPGGGSNLNGTASLAAGSSPDFSGGPTPLSLADATNAVLSYSYAPTTRGPDTATVRFVFGNGSADQTNSPETVLQAISGVGVGPVYESSTPPFGKIDFGYILLGDTDTHHLIIGNPTPDPNGGDPTLTDLTLLLATLTGAEAGMFSLPGFVPGAVVGQSGTLDVEILFGASAPGLKVAALTFTTDLNAPYGSPGSLVSYQLEAHVLQSWSDIPEPATVSLLGLGGLALLARRRRARRR